MPKLITNKCKNWYRTICGKSSTIILFWSVKTCKFIVRVIKFEGFARWVRGREIHQKRIKN
jgi:hypothetical protein